ncbi:MAG: hypothetical protein J6N95_01865 [Bacilli bacterium]|nr:hypothetical protein [Bacilli bacterium]
MKKGTVISIIISSLCLLAIPLTVLSFGLAIPTQFDETYYGELPYLFKRLKNGKEGKIIFVGNSAIAFGNRKDLIEKELNKEVVTFGLYGAIGTKAMMDLSKAGIKKGDIVVLSPEISEQGLSLYFSSENMWMAIDGHYDMLNYLAKDNKESMVGNFASFAAKKFDYMVKGKKPKVDGVYQQSSFNKDNQEVGYMTYNREYNYMVNGYDANSMVKFDVNYLNDEFIKYINDYCKYVKKKGAEVYYNFVPVNNLSVTSSKEDIDAFYDELNDRIMCPILGSPHNYIFDYEWFYDNNSHLNTAGTYIYNKQLIDDLKTVFKDSSPTNIGIPEKPDIPLPDYHDGDNSDLDCFNYEEEADGYVVTSLTEKGLEKTTVIIPSTYNEKPIISFDATVFQNSKTITEIVVPANIRTLADFSFKGCSNLTKLIIQHASPSLLNVGTSLLEEADNCYVYVKSDVYDIFANHYNWGYYRNKLKKY